MAVSSGAQCGSYAVVALDRRKASTRRPALLDSQLSQRHSILGCLRCHPVSSAGRHRPAGVPAPVRTCSRQRLVEQGANPPSGERSSVMRRGYLDRGHQYRLLDAVWRFGFKMHTLRMEPHYRSLRLARISLVIRLELESRRSGGSVKSGRCESSKGVQAALGWLGTDRHG